MWIYSPAVVGSSVTSLHKLLKTLDRQGRGFERLAQWFLTTDPEFGSHFAEVWLWDDWPGRWDIDRGIDLVARRHDGGLVAVQAKNYAPGYSITKHDVDAFLSESSRPVFAERLLIGTTDKLARGARDVMDAQEKPVSRCLLSRLEEAEVSWPAHVDELAAAPPVKHEVRPHQQAALEEIDKGLRTGDRGQVVMACGTGKSLVAVRAAEAQEAEVVLVLVPTIPLLRQTAQVWATHSMTDFAALKVCSERDQRRSRGSSEEDDDLDLGPADVGPGTTTDPDAIAEFLTRSGRRIVFSTYKSSPKVAEAMRTLPDARFDLIVFDEAHRCAGLVDKPSKSALDDSLIRARKRLFFTATPELYRAKDVQFLRHRQVQVASMNNAEIFGPVLYKLSLADAIERKLLCPYQVVFMPVREDEVDRLIRHRTHVTPDHGETRTDAYSLAAQIACAKAMRKYGCRRMVSFHPRIEHSRHFADHFAKAVELLSDDERPEGEIIAAHVDGGRMAPAKRRAILRQFEQSDETHRLLSNVKLLSEGFDAPGIDAISVIDTERGETQIIQMIGRAVRPMEGKEVGTIVLPVLVHGTETPEEAMARTEHRPIVKLLAALRSSDPDLERSLDHLRVEVGSDGREIPKRRRFVLDVARDVGPEFAEAIGVMLVDTLAPSKRAAFEKESRARRVASAAEETVVSAPIELWGIDQDGPMPPPLMVEGIEVLDSYIDSGLGFAPGPRTMHNGAPLGRWWTKLLETWDDTTPDMWSKRRIAQLVSWLSIDGTDHPTVRADLMALSSRSVVDHIHADLDTEEGQLADLVRMNVIGQFSDLSTTRIHAALTYPAMPLDDQVELVDQALHDAGWETLRRDPSNRKAFADGFLDALEHHPSPCPVDADPASFEADDSAGQYVSGWEHAGSFFAAALEARSKRRQAA